MGENKGAHNPHNIFSMVCLCGFFPHMIVARMRQIVSCCCCSLFNLCVYKRTNAFKCIHIGYAHVCIWMHIDNDDEAQTMNTHTHTHVTDTNSRYDGKCSNEICMYMCIRGIACICIIHKWTNSRTIRCDSTHNETHTRIACIALSDCICVCVCVLRGVSEPNTRDDRRDDDTHTERGGDSTKFCAATASCCCVRGRDRALIARSLQYSNAVAVARAQGARLVRLMVRSTYSCVCRYHIQIIYAACKKVFGECITMLCNAHLQMRTKLHFILGCS